ncbi:protein archease-like [Uloborus diversus]|uniref:protein archease-like n=1 Tax=Uloborus diversus TaxID=327109 RepID=UPI002409F4FF|nr:protein archease-like [Uloborus diversus]
MAEAGDVDDGYDHESDPPNQEFSEEDLRIPPIKYEYLDHPADIQLHSWGDTLTEAFEQAAVAMFGYMTEIDKVDVLMTQDIEAEGHDMLSLLFHYLDEFLYIFSAEPYFIARKVKILNFDKQNFKIKARGYGEIFDLDKHPQGSEVKAITYSNMQVHENEDKSELFVIVDI